MRLKINISPCPNDTFMFDAMLHGKIDCEGLEFDVDFYDIEQLNQNAIGDNTLQISKISYAILPKIIENYLVLNSGSALGFGNGPLLVSHKKGLVIDDRTTVICPGEHTTASLLIKKIYPQTTKINHTIFSQIASEVQKKNYDAGVLIHEGRFTFGEKNLSLVVDLGHKWEALTSLPLPLGAIVVNRNLPEDLQKKIDRVLRRSIEFAMKNPHSSQDFVRSHAQEMSEQVTKNHIEMFVNDFSLDLGTKGQMAVEKLCDLSKENIFVR